MRVRRNFFLLINSIGGDGPVRILAQLIQRYSDSFAPTRNFLSLPLSAK